MRLRQMQSTNSCPKFGFVAAVAGAVLLSFGAGMATEYQSQDARWWRETVPASARVFVVEGMLDAYDSGWRDGAEAQEDRVTAALAARYVKSMTLADVGRVLDAA